MIETIGRRPLILDPSNLEWSQKLMTYGRLDLRSFVHASRLNAKSDSLVSWHREPGATAVDAFSITWANFNCYAFSSVLVSCLDFRPKK